MGSVLTTEVFIEECGGSVFLIYSPLRQTAFVGNKATADLLRSLKGGENTIETEESKDLLSFLRTLGFVDGQPDRLPSDSIGIFAPTEVVLLPTSDCYLRCIYCFSEGGNVKRNMPWGVAKAAIDLVLRNATNSGVDPLVIFHGGGEPTLNWDVLVHTTEYVQEQARRIGLKARISLVSNGIWSESRLKWIEANVNRLTVSFDGPEDIQDYQRPFRSGRGSFKYVERTCSRLTADKMPFGVRATITKHNVGRMTDMVRLFTGYSVNALQFEPLSVCGRCIETSCEPPDPELYVDEFKQAWHEAHAKGINLYCSGTRILRLGTRFCGAAGASFCVTPDGYVSSCHRVSEILQPEAKHFIYGRYDQRQNAFVIDNNKLAKLQALDMGGANACSNCFCKWHCAGGCYQQNWRATGELLLRAQSERCYFTRELTKYRLDELIRENERRL